MMGKKEKYRIIEENGRKYILVSDAPRYLSDLLGTSFGILSYRSIRHYVTRGVLRRPKRLGKETFFELEYIIPVLKVIYYLSECSPSIEQTKKIIRNIGKHDQIDQAIKVLKVAHEGHTIQSKMVADKFLEYLEKKKPSDINLREMMEEVMEEQMYLDDRANALYDEWKNG